MIKSMLVACAVVLLSACTSQYPNQQVTGKQFPSISGESLEKNMVTIPSDFKADKTLILIGYKQDSQFDIDRWLIGLDMAGTTLPTYELPTIAGMAPRMFSSFIDSGMRKGIPKELWGGVITIYNDGEAVQKFTGNQRPNNSRVVLIDSNGKILYFYDRGFSVDALNKLKARIE
ncbi:MULTISPECIES: hypothetical protein [Pseudoalteromonas]|jgi:hypothetical protein|uniref:Lipoprotein n=1 Tax=Pseudoalteromonas aliena SW19 TaxID=1314866 RepID=A0ABR9DY21_9GAMM|nr:MULTISPECIES: hypothetical protein [Pseudoalteromonas]MBE0359254.1 hypothetical protein [Pseudoalteromonas aliena SW19]